ncbi:cell division protein FtsA [Candidatus Azambacteria bacterium]|nr:cell division protein FtsA [Candidatus Azambacteria bacterium]
MAKEFITCGLDIGTAKVRAVVIQKRKGAEKLSVVGVGEAPSSGVKRGMIADINEAVESIRNAIAQAEQTSGKTIESVFANLSGPHMTSRSSKGVVAVSRADQEISKEDKQRVLQTTEAISIPQNRKIVHVIPKEFIVDGEGGIKEPLGMSGVRLEVNALLIDCSVAVINNVKKAVESVGLDIDDLIISPVASSKAVLSKRQKELGVMVIDIGGGTTGVSVFEDGSMTHIAVLPVGSNHITNDIAIGLRTEIDIAERVKLEYGTADPESVNKKDMIDLAELGFGLAKGGAVSRRHIAEIIEARLDEIFELAEKELKKVSKQGLLPGGIVLVGGGAKLPHIVEAARNRLKLPVQIGVPGEGLDGILDRVADPEYASAVGLALMGFDEPSIPANYQGASSGGGFFSKILKSLRVFMP